MDNYHRKNLVEYYRQMIALCVGTMVLMTILTIYTVSKSYERARKAEADTYVYGSNGASIHVYSKENDQWKTY